MFQSKKSTGDYHDEMKSETHKNCMHEQLHKASCIKHIHSLCAFRRTWP